MVIDGYRIRSLASMRLHFCFERVWAMMEDGAGFARQMAQLAGEDLSLDLSAQEKLRTLQSILGWPDPQAQDQLLARYFTPSGDEPGWLPRPAVAEAAPYRFVGRVIPEALRESYAQFMASTAFTQEMALDLLRFLFLYDALSLQASQEDWQRMMQHLCENALRSRWLRGTDHVITRQTREMKNGEIILPLLNMKDVESASGEPLTLVRFRVDSFGLTVRLRIGPLMRAIRRGAALYALRRGSLGFTGFVDVMDERVPPTGWTFGGVKLLYAGDTIRQFEGVREDACLLPCPGDGKTLFIGWDNTLYEAGATGVQKVKCAERSVVAQACSFGGRYAWITDEGCLIMDGKRVAAAQQAYDLSLCAEGLLWLDDLGCHLLKPGGEAVLLDPGKPLAAFSARSGLPVDRCGGEWNWNI